MEWTVDRHEILEALKAEIDASFENMHAEIHLITNGAEINVYLTRDSSPVKTHKYCCSVKISKKYEIMVYTSMGLVPLQHEYKAIREIADPNCFKELFDLIIEFGGVLRESNPETISST